jgi:shikimate dehydrogenase
VRLALIGWPLGHSVSPALQQAALAHHGLPGSYERLETAPEHLGEAVARLRDGRLDGANVTVPHKQAVLTWVDALAPSAARAGAANTLVVERSLGGGRRIIAHNTDIEGFTRAWDEHFGAGSLGGRRVLVIGAGGAARAAGLAALQGQADSLLIVNRDLARAQTLQAHLAQAAAALQATQPQLAAAPLGDFAQALGGYDAIVQSTSCGMAKHQLQPPVAWPEHLTPEQLACLQVMDLVYNPPRSAFVEAFPGPPEAAVGGLSMLVHQGAAAFELWTQREAPLTVIRRAAQDALGLA